MQTSRESRGCENRNLEQAHSLGSQLCQLWTFVRLMNRVVFFIGLGWLCAAGCAEPKSSVMVDQRERYDKPLLSPGAQFAAVPPAVQNTIRAETGSADIDKIIKTTNYGRVVYTVTFENHGGYPPLNIAPDGSMLDRDFLLVMGAPQEKANVVTGGPVAGVTLNDLPKEVVKEIQRQAPNAEIDIITKEVHGDKTTYLITFKDRMHEPLRLGSDGTVL